MYRHSDVKGAAPCTTGSRYISQLSVSYESNKYKNILEHVMTFLNNGFEKLLW
jgi:hypothetical protein